MEVMYNLYFATCMYFTLPKYIFARLKFQERREAEIFISECTFRSVQENEVYVHPRKMAEPLLLWRN